MPVAIRHRLLGPNPSRKGSNAIANVAIGNRNQTNPGMLEVWFPCLERIFSLRQIQLHISFGKLKTTASDLNPHMLLIEPVSQFTINVIPIEPPPTTTKKKSRDYGALSTFRGHHRQIQ
jgi:hypothetical protein